MGRVCQLTGKKPSAGNNRPFSLKATKRTFRPNLFMKKVFNPLTGKVERMKLSAKAIKTLKKWAVDNGKVVEYDNKTKQVKGAASVSGEGKHVKKDKLTPKQKKEEAAAAAIQVAEAAEMKANAEKSE